MKKGLFLYLGAFFLLQLIGARVISNMDFPEHSKKSAAESPPKSHAFIDIGSDGIARDADGKEIDSIHITRNGKWVHVVDESKPSQSIDIDLDELKDEDAEEPRGLQIDPPASPRPE